VRGSAEQDAVAEKFEAGASKHLAFQEFRFGVTPSVVPLWNNEADHFLSPPKVRQSHANAG
jgi:hypothetical protein